MTVWAASVLQILRGRQVLSLREQNPVRVRLRRAAGVRQHGDTHANNAGSPQKAVTADA